MTKIFPEIFCQKGKNKVTRLLYQVDETESKGCELDEATTSFAATSVVGSHVVRKTSI